MRKYLSLGSALMMGVVLGKEKQTYAFASEAVEAPRALPLGLNSMLPAQTFKQVAKVAKQHETEKKYKRVDSPVTSVATSSATPDVMEKRANSSLTSKDIDVSPSPNVKMVVEIYCGVQVNAVPGYNFYCLDWKENRLYHCIGRNDWQYQCWDGAEWEWGNYLERDGTADNSLLTSLHTDH